MDTPRPAITDTLASDDPSEVTASDESTRSSFSGSLAARRQLGHYQLLDELGRGGMGVVYAAHDSKLGRKVAIKMLRAEGDAKLQRRLIREAKAMAKLAHPNVVSVHEIGEHDGATFIVMEYVEGRTLRRWLAEAQRSLAEILAAFMAAGHGLAAIHAAGLIHRDFKPDNLMIRDSGHVLVMDLGIARDESAAFKPARLELDGVDDAAVDLTRDGALMGSPAYMAAEQFNAGEVTPKTDQFSFCVSLWEALYGERPFASENLVTLVDSVTAGRLRAARRRDVPAALRSVLERGLRAKPEARFASMEALLDAIERASRSRVRGRLAMGVGLVAAIVLVGVGVVAATDDAGTVTATTDTMPSEAPTQPKIAPAAAGEPSRHRQLTATGTALMPALSPDGQHVVFVDDEGFVHVDLRSNETKELIPEVSNVLESRLSNDGSLLFTGSLVGEPAVYRMSSLDSTPVRIPEVLPTFCRFPDRDTIASIKLPGKAVRLTDGKGNLVAEIAVEGEYEWLREVACDPEHNRVVVLHSLGATETLKLIDLDGGPARVLVESSLELASPCFDKTGETLYYLAKRDGQTNLEATPVAVDDDLPVTRIVVPNVDATAFSRADSGRLAYVRTRTIQRGIWKLGETDVSFERASQIVETDAEQVYFAVSPDETQLAYVESRRNLGRLMIRPLSGGVERELARSDRLRHVAWSPDGETLAFIAQYRGQAHVWTVTAAGGTPTWIKSALASDTPPLAWAPSERIIYERPENRNFGVLDPITGDERLLIADDSVGWAFAPTVSPDGASVAVFWNRPNRGVWTIDIEHGTPQQVIEGRYDPMTWSADGRFIYAQGEDHLPMKIYRLPAEGVGTEQPELWRTLDFGPRRSASCHVLSSEALLCAVVETATDIWLAEAIE